MEYLEGYTVRRFVSGKKERTGIITDWCFDNGDTDVFVVLWDDDEDWTINTYTNKKEFDMFRPVDVYTLAEISDMTKFDLENTKERHRFL